MVDASEVEEYQKKFDAVKEEIEKVIVGYEDVVDDFLVCLITGGHLLIEGVPGLAKTTLIKTFTKAMGLGYDRVQFTQDLLPADISGHYFYDQKENEFELRKGPIFTQVLMADEINRSPPKTQSALIEAMQERQVTIEGSTFDLPAPFLVIATRNPIETEGVYPLPEAQLDRFMIKSDMDYLAKEDELDMLKMKDESLESEDVRSLGDGFGEDLQGIHEDIHVADSVLRYIRDIVLKTRDVEDLVLGASPRGGEQLLYSSKAAALIDGRSYVIPDDVKKMAAKVLNHKLILSVDSELEGIQTREVISEIIDEQVEVPRGDFSR